MTDADFLDVRVGIGVQSTADSAVSLQWPERFPSARNSNR